MSESHEFEKRNVRRSFERSAATYDAAAVLQREVERRMFERLDYVKLAPATVLDAGSGTGTGARELARRYPDARVIALDIALTIHMGMAYVCPQPSKYTLPILLDDVCLAFPDLKIIAYHMGWPYHE